MSVSHHDVIQAINAIQLSFHGGSRWGRGMLHNPMTGERCMLGALQALRARDSNGREWEPAKVTDAAIQFIEQAVRELAGSSRQFRDLMSLFGNNWIPWFNDSRTSYAEIAAALERAKELVMLDYRKRHPHSPLPVRALPVRGSVPQLPPPPVRAALPPPAPAVPIVIDVEFEPVRNNADWR